MWRYRNDRYYYYYQFGHTLRTSLIGKFAVNRCLELGLDSPKGRNQRLDLGLDSPKGLNRCLELGLESKRPKPMLGGQKELGLDSPERLK